ncbi:hypothetical protein SK128_028432, partial [Halocaridina rubra]
MGSSGLDGNISAFLDDPPPRPPERPPKKPNLRSLFHGPINSEATHASPSGVTGTPASAPNGVVIPSAAAEKTSPDSEMVRRIEESANELRNLSPARSYYYRKPPAPDPPRSPEATTTPLAAAATTPSVASPSTISTTPTTSPRQKSRSPPHGAPRLHIPPIHVAHLIPPTSPVSRSSTPDLPPPPPPPLTDGEVVVSDEPLPPPPTPSE